MCALSLCSKHNCAFQFSGFKDEVAGRGIGEMSLEFGVVQDADRLDAIGAIGNNM